MSVLLIVGLKYTMVALHTSPGKSRWVCTTRCIKVSLKDGTDRRTDARLLHYTCR